MHTAFSGKGVAVLMKNEIWVYVEHNGKMIEKVSLELLGEAFRLAKITNLKVAALLFGFKTDVVLQNLLEYGGMEKIYWAEHKLLRYFYSEFYTYVLEKLARQEEPQIILFGATPDGNDLGLRIAVRLGTGFLNNCHDLKLNESGAFVLSKRVMEDSQLSVSTAVHPLVATVIPDVIGLKKIAATATPEIKQISLDNIQFVGKSEVLAFQEGDPAQMDICEADRIVSGGRGINGPAQWNLLEALATRLEAAIAGSRMAKDLGYISRERMVGQTGRFVTPRLYFAVGISGATQHLHGMKDAQKIIAVNKDRQAPLMKQADLAVVANIEELLPVLIKKIDEYTAPKA